MRFLPQESYFKEWCHYKYTAKDTYLFFTNNFDVRDKLIHTEQTVPEFLVASPEHQLSNAKISEGIMRNRLTTDTPTDRCLCLRLLLKPELASP